MFFSWTCGGNRQLQRSEKSTGIAFRTLGLESQLPDHSQVTSALWTSLPHEKRVSVPRVHGRSKQTGNASGGVCVCGLSSTVHTRAVAIDQRWVKDAVLKDELESEQDGNGKFKRAGYVPYRSSHFIYSMALKSPLPHFWNTDSHSTDDEIYWQGHSGVEGRDMISAWLGLFLKPMLIQSSSEWIILN